MGGFPARQAHQITSTACAPDKDSTDSEPSFELWDRQLGLQNFGNTCYCNSVLQVLYYCRPFRRHCLKHRHDGDGMLSALSELFFQIEQQRKSKPLCSSSVAPKKFIQKLRQEHEMFRSADHHDAHEFFNFLMNDIAEHLVKHNPHETNLASSPSSSSSTSQPPYGPPVHRTRGGGQLPGGHASSPHLLSAESSMGSNRRGPSSSKSSTPQPRRHGSSPTSTGAAHPKAMPIPPQPPPPPAPEPKSWVHALFEGSLVYETKCLCCENITRRREPFLDLSVEVEQQDSTLETCIRKFSSKEKLVGKDKYFCDECSCLQEAERFSSIGKLPRFLAVHLKRFKFDESQGRYARLPHRVEFPTTLSLTCCDPECPKASYELFAVIVHIGMSMTHGHYVCCLQSHGRWYLFDDHLVTPISPESLRHYYGSSKDSEGVKCGYLIFYSSKSHPSQPSTFPTSAKMANAAPATKPSSPIPPKTIPSPTLPSATQEAPPYSTSCASPTVPPQQLDTFEPRYPLKPTRKTSSAHPRRSPSFASADESPVQPPHISPVCRRRHPSPSSPPTPVDGPRSHSVARQTDDFTRRTTSTRRRTNRKSTAPQPSGNTTPTFNQSTSSNDFFTPTYTPTPEHCSDYPHEATRSIRARRSAGRTASGRTTRTPFGDTNKSQESPVSADSPIPIQQTSQTTFVDHREGDVIQREREARQRRRARRVGTPSPPPSSPSASHFDHTSEGSGSVAGCVGLSSQARENAAPSFTTAIAHASCSPFDPGDDRGAYDAYAEAREDVRKLRLTPEGDGYSHGCSNFFGLSLNETRMCWGSREDGESLIYNVTNSPDGVVSEIVEFAEKRQIFHMNESEF